jgi:hypothetical protein
VHRLLARYLVMLLIALQAIHPNQSAWGSSQEIDFSACVPDDSGEYLICKGGRSVYIGGGSAPSAAWPPPGWLAYNRVSFDDQGEPCMFTDYAEPGPGGLIPDIVNEYEGGTRVPDGLFPQCSAIVGDPMGPGAIAAYYWERIPLPRPDPYAAPGWAIVGKAVYLETRGTTTYSYTSDTDIGRLEILATGRYEVDWGDGSSSGPHSAEGRAWPDGEITHEYIWSGSYDIVVTQRWVATWSLAGRSGTLRQLQTEGRIEGFPAREIQAVVGAVPR